MKSGMALKKREFTHESVSVTPMLFLRPSPTRLQRGWRREGGKLIYWVLGGEAAFSLFFIISILFCLHLRKGGRGREGGQRKMPHPPHTPPPQRRERVSKIFFKIPRRSQFHNSENVEDRAPFFVSLSSLHFFFTKLFLRRRAERKYKKKYSK